MFQYLQNILWPNDVDAHSQDVLLLLSDESNEKTKQLSVSFPKLICYTRPDQHLSSLKVTLKMEFDKAVDLVKLVSSLVRRYETYFLKQSVILLPPQRFAEALPYCSQNFYTLSEFFEGLASANDFDDEDIWEMLQIRSCKEDKTLEHLTKLSRDYPYVVKLLNKIRTKKTLPLDQALETIENLWYTLDTAMFDRYYPEEIEKIVGQSGFKQLCSIASQIYSCQFDFEADKSMDEQLSKDDLQYFRYAPISGMDRKRCFPRFEASSQPFLSYSNMCSVIYCFYESISE